VTIFSTDTDLFLADFGGELVASGVTSGTKGILTHRVVEIADEFGRVVRHRSAVLKVKAGTFDVATDTAFTLDGISYKTRGTALPDSGDGAFEIVDIVRA
jgi:hypothetical protein